jgi:hypothetical protein
LACSPGALGQPEALQDFFTALSKTMFLAAQTVK